MAVLIFCRMVAESEFTVTSSVMCMYYVGDIIMRLMYVIFSSQTISTHLTIHSVMSYTESWKV